MVHRCVRAWVMYYIEAATAASASIPEPRMEVNSVMDVRRGAAALLLLAFCSTASPLPPTRLRVEYLENPQGVDVTAPRLSWALNHGSRGEIQTGYQVVV